MKNTRIARLKQSKRVRKVSKVVAIGLLVCPLTLGAINALADTETTEPVTEEVTLVEETVASETVESTEPVETVESTPIVEEAQQPVLEAVQPEDPIVTSYLSVDEDGTTRGTLEELGADLSELRSLYAQVTAEIDKGDPVAGTSTIYTDESYLAFLTDVVDKWANTEQFFTSDYHTAEDVPIQMAYVNDFIAAFQSGLSKLVLRSGGSMQDYGIDTTALEAAIRQADYAVANSSLYTPESFSDFNTGDGILSAAQIIQASKDNLAKTDWLNADIAQHNIDVSLGMLNHILDKLVLAPTVEQVNYYIDCEFTDGTATQTISLTGEKGASVTETAPNINSYYVVSQQSITQVIDEGTRFVFTYAKDIIYDAVGEVVGETTATTGETKSYSLKVHKYYGSGKIETEDLEFDGVNFILSSDSADAMVDKGQVTFKKAGTYVLSAGGGELTVVVSDKATEEINTDALEAAVAKANVLNAADYKDFSSVTSALANASNVLASPTSQTEVDQATADLLNAINTLEKKDVNNGGGNGTDNGGNTGGNGTDNSNNSNTNQDENNNNSSNPSNTNSNSNKANNQTATNNNTKDTTNLPQTGDTPTNLFISGLTLLGTSIFALIIRKRQKV